MRRLRNDDGRKKDGLYVEADSPSLIIAESLVVFSVFLVEGAMVD